MNGEQVQRLAAFADAGEGGNPAGVVIDTTLPDALTMQRTAAEVGYSETAFAARESDGWRVRYFSPETEVPFCGHATIALGAALAARHGDAVFSLQLNDARITVEGRATADGAMSAALQSPPTRSSPADPELLARTLTLFGYDEADLDPAMAPRLANAGAEHLIVPLATRAALGRMTYHLDAGRALMRDAGLVTIAFTVCRDERRYDMRNAFASGGVLEDPATGAAAAALAGMLRDLGRPASGVVDLVQGEDMGKRSRLRVEFDSTIGDSVRVSGDVRHLDAAV